MTVLYNRSLICAFYHRFGFFHTLINISDKVIGTGKYIIFFIEMNWWFAAIHGFSRMDFHRIFFIFHLNLFQRSGCNNFILCNNRCNIISIIAHATGQQIPVCHILMCQFHRPWMSRCRIAMIRDIMERHNLHHPFHDLGLTCINRFYDSISNCCMQHFRHQTFFRK